jgi:hypothetical protein
MLGRKTTGTSQETPLDKKILEQEERAWDARMELKRITENILVHSGIVNFFPQDSTIWVEISKELEEEKRSLLLAIDDYEREKQLYNSFIEIEGERTYTRSWIKWDNYEWTPQKTVADVYRNFYRRVK